MTAPISATPWDLAAGNRWTIQSEDHRIANDRGNETVVDANGNVVAYVGGNNDEGGNGQLLAAAPALRDALAKIATHLADRCDSGILDLTPEAKLWDLARAALKQAGAL
jgi:hypothetical protein